MGANWSSDDFSSCSPAPTSRTSFPYQPSCISSSTPSLRISSAPSVRASMRSRLDRSVTPPPLLLAAAGPSSGPVHLDARSSSTNYSTPPVNADLSIPIRIESQRSFPAMETMALSCPTVVAIGTPPAYSASSPSARPTSGIASARPVNGPAPGPVPGSIPGPVPGPAHMRSCGPISESTSNRGSTLGPVLGSSNSPTFGSTRDSIHVPAIGATHSPAFRSTHAPTHSSTSVLTIHSTHAPALGSSHGSTQSPAFGSSHGSTHGPAFGSTQSPAFGSSHGSTRSPAFGSTQGSTHSPAFGSSHGPAFGATHGSTHSPAFGSTHGPAPLPTSAPPARDLTPLNEGPCAAGPPCSSSTSIIQPPSTSPPPPTPPPPLEVHPSCSCSREVELLRNETRLLRAELTKSRQTMTQMKEREKLLRHRLSEQARRQIERGGSAKFEDISLGENRPSQLIRRYGNLYSEGRLDAMDALDELREVAEFNDLKEKLLLSVIVLAFRNARRNVEEMKSQVRHLLHISDQPPPPPPPPPPHHHHPSHPAPSISSSGRDPAGVTLKARPLPPSHPAVVELEEIIAVYLRKTLEHQNLTRNYQEVRERVWATLFDFPKLRFCRGLQHYIEECVRLAWALTLQNPPYVVDYKTKVFSPDAHTRFHTSDPDSVKIRTVLWPALREGGDAGPCVYKGVVIT